QQILGMSFGVIFSIFLIIFFIIIAFIVIKNFLGVQDCTKLGIFLDKLKADVKKTWNSQIDSHTFRGDLPSRIQYVCFADLSKPMKGDFRNMSNTLSLYEGKGFNLFFYPFSDACEMPAHTIPHIDIEGATTDENPLCIPVRKGTVLITIEKDLNDPLVTINRAS
ncbi:MAG: hypothetical protein RL557_926, partial [archaeon]